MSARRPVVLLTMALVLAGCSDDAPGEDVDLAEPQVGVGEEITYQGAVDSDEAWELSVVVDEIDCDVDVEEEADLEATVEERTCAVLLTLENTGDEPNIESLLQASSLITDDGATAIASEVATGAYIEEQGLHPSVGVAPGETVETAMLFTVPTEAEPTQLHLQAGADDERIVVELDG